ncbi:MAG: hypothetical protein WCW67_03640 [Candidatus Margulisiibacteriota bacterium]|jgi:hypothetical protein
MPLTQQAADEIMKKYPGEVRGVAFQTDAEYVKKKWGEEGLLRVGRRLSELGYPVEYDKIKPLVWLPLGLRILSLLVIDENFNMTKEELQEMGYTAPKFSFLMKWLVKFFSSAKTMIESAPAIWKKHYTVGELETAYHGEEKFALVKVKGLVLPKSGIEYIQGYFRRVLEFSVGSAVHCELIKSPDNGADYYEFKAWWN